MNKDKLMNCFFENNSLSALTEEIGNDMKCSVIITDSAFHVVSSYCGDGICSNAYKTAVMHKELSFKACAYIKEKEKEVSDGKIELLLSGEEKRKYTVQRLICSGVHLGYVICEFSSGSESDICGGDLDFCCGLLSKQLYMARHCNGTSVSTSEEILSELLEGKFENEQRFLLQTEGTFLSGFCPKSFAVIKFAEKMTEENAEREEGVINRLGQIFHASHPFVFNESIIMFLHEDHEVFRLKDFAEQYNLRIIISAELDKLYNMKTEYCEICGINRYFDDIKYGTGKLVYEKDYAYLMELKKLASRSCLMDEKIKELLKYDKENKSELCLTLYTYLICRHSRKAVGDRLFIHSNTVSYRLEKIRDEFSICTDMPSMHFLQVVSLAQALIILGHDELFIAGR